MPRPAFLILDTLDDRREIHSLLGRLSPADRVAFAKWCCDQVHLAGSKIHPHPSRRMDPTIALARKDDRADERLTTELYMDFWRLANTYKLDVTAAAKELERRVKSRR